MGALPALTLDNCRLISTIFDTTRVDWLAGAQ